MSATWKGTPERSCSRVVTVSTQRYNAAGNREAKALRDDQPTGGAKIAQQCPQGT